MQTRGGFEAGEINESQMMVDMYSNNDLYSPGAARMGYYYGGEGRLNSLAAADWAQGITPRLHK